MAAAALFLSFEGRVERSRWIMGVAILIAAMLVAAAGIEALASRGLIDPALAAPARLFVTASLLSPWMALDWKRFHDLGAPGWLAIFCPALLVLSHGWERAAPVLGLLYLTWPAVAIAGAQLALGVALAALLPLMRGTAGPNRYGPDPLAANVPQAKAHEP